MMALDRCLRLACCTTLALIGFVPMLTAQWTHRYPKVAGYGRHIYLEGYELPVMGSGPTDPAPSPDGKTLAISARGWLWLLDTTSREARRLTNGAHMDSRPAWSPDGQRLAFVRDDGADTSIVEVTVATSEEKVLLDTPGLDLDPAFSPDGGSLLYSSAEAGDLDLWRLELSTGEKTRLTTRAGLELLPLPLPDDVHVVYLRKGGGARDAVCLLDTRDETSRVLVEEGYASQTRPALSPDGRSLAVNLPAQDRWELWLMDIEGGSKIQLAPDAFLPLTPTWSPDGSDIYFVQPDEQERFQIHRAPAAGGDVSDVSPMVWDWDEPLGRLVIRTRRAGEAAPLPARLTMVDRDGHPVLPEHGQTRFDSQNGLVYTYSPGVTTVEVPPGEVRITATHGFVAPAVSARRTVGAGETTTVDLEITPLWDPSSEGWYSGDLHFHLDWGGTYRLVPEDLVGIAQAEDLEVITPLAASLDVRIKDIPWWDWKRLGSGPPLIVFGQEVRPSPLGHTGFIGITSRFWPNYWGTGYPVYRYADIPKSDVHDHAHAQGGISIYVHPVAIANPFPEDADPNGIPLELVPDAVLGDLDALEIVCLWSDAEGTSEVWYHLLNLGLNIVPTGGSDALVDWYRSMSVGSDRVYAHVEGALNFESFLEAVTAGRTFVTTGPLMKFTVDEKGPGSVVQASPGDEIEWALTVWSPTPAEKIEVLMNGDVVWQGEGLAEAGQKSCNGRVKATVGGWVAARVYGGPTSWPVMDGVPFAHSAPTWLGKVGSRDLLAARRSARELLRWMDVAESRLNERYGNAPIPRIRKRFADARSKLEAVAQ